MNMAAKGQHAGAPDKSAQASPIQHSLGPIRLSPGISRAQVGIYLLTVVVTFCVLQFVGLFLPFFLTEMLHIPKAARESWSGIWSACSRSPSWSSSPSRAAWPMSSAGSACSRSPMGRSRRCC